MIKNKTPTADLIGDATQAVSTSAATSANKSGFFANNNTVSGELTNGAAGTNELSQGVTTPSNSLVVVAASALYNSESTGSYHVRVLDGSTTLKTTSVSITNGTTRTISVLFVGVPLSGARTYNVQCWDTAPGGGLLCWVTLDISHVQLTDTHAGVGKKLNQIIKG